MLKQLFPSWSRHCRKPAQGQGTSPLVEARNGHPLPRLLRCSRGEQPLQTARTGRARRRPARAITGVYRLARLEPLEVRTLLSVDFWAGGGADNHWSTAANWAGDTAPSAGDNLIFPSGPTKTSTNNDFAAGTAFGSIAISGSGYTLAGNAVTLQTGLSDSGGNASVSLPITLGAAESLLNSSSGTLTLNGAIDENGFPLTLEADNGPTTVNGQVSGSGGLVKAGYGEVVLAVANTYTGTTQVNAGTLDIQNAQSLGATDGTAATETTVNGGTLTLDGSFAVSNDLLTLTNGTLQSNGNAGWADNVDLAGNYDDYFSPPAATR